MFTRHAQHGAAVSKDPLPTLAAGVLGRFWTLVKDPTPSGQLKEEDAHTGQLQIVAGVVRVKTQAPVPTPTLEDWHETLTSMTAGPEPAPGWIFGITELGTVVVPVVSSESRHEPFSGTYVSTRTFRGPAIAVGVEAPFGPRLTQLAVRLPFATWADLDPLKTTGHFDDQHRWTGLDLELRGTNDLDCGRVGSIALSLRGTWNRQADEEQGHRTSIETALQVITRSKTAREHTEHVEVAMSVQDLLSAAYDRFLPAAGARAVLEGDKTDHSSTWFYHRDLVEAPDLTGEPDPDPNTRPLFTLKDLGGPKAVSRWVALNRAYPDAANAVLVRNRTPTNTTRRTIELGAAIEQYVNTNFAEARARGREKTSWTRSRQPEPAALALHAGADFARLVGDPIRWGRCSTRPT